MKRLFNYLFIFLIILLPFNIFAETSNFVDEYNSSDIIKISSGNYDLIIDDMANLLSDADKIKLQDEMSGLLEYGNIAFVSSDNLYGSVESKASSYYYKNFGEESGTVFYIDMETRYISQQ